MKTVGIIGGSGFIGSYNTKRFLEEGFKVKVSATDISKKGKYEHLRQLPHAENLEIVQLNVENKSELAEFLKGCSVVVHGGTPFQLEVQDPKKELFDPTIKGTENFLETVEKTPGIEKVVFIASIAAQNTNYPFPPGDQSPTDIINEGDEPFMSEESHPYAQAKFMAHQTVEKYVAEHPGVEFEVSTVSPAFVTGRAMSQREDSTSMGLQYLFKNKIAPNPLVQMMYDTNVAFAMVDVEDVAEGVFQAATKTGIHGNNYFLSNESYPVSDISLMLNGKEPEGKPWVVYSNEGARNDLEMEFKPAQQSLNQVF